MEWPHAGTTAGMLAALKTQIETALSAGNVDCVFPLKTDVSGSGLVTSIASVAIDTTLSAAHYTVLVDATAGNRVITLPTAASAYSAGVGRVYNIKKIDVSANTVTVDGASAETIDGAATQVLTDQWQNITIQSNGTTWSIT